MTQEDYNELAALKALVDEALDGWMGGYSGKGNLLLAIHDLERWILEHSV